MLIPTLLIAGCVALLLFGIRFLRKGLDRLFGERLGWWLQKLASTRIKAFFAGIFVAVASPSSTTISLLTVQAVQAGHLSSRQSLAVALGANIGLTAPALLLGLSIDAYAPLLILVGMGLFIYTRSSRSRGIGQVILSLGLVFLAVHLIRGYVGDIVSDTNPHDDLAKLIDIAERHPFWLASIAAVITILLQSSTATIGLIIGLTAGGFDSMAIAYPAVLGTNVGLGITMVFVGWKQTDSRRMAFANLALKVLTAIILIAFAGFIIPWMERQPGSTTQHITYLHTGFNILQAIIGLPLVHQVSVLAERFIAPAPDYGEDTFGPRYIDETSADTAPLALGQSLREITRVSEIVRQMLDELWLAIKNNDEVKVREISRRDDQVDLLDSRIKQYLAQMGSRMEDLANSREQINQLTYLTGLENIGDIIDRNLADLALKKIKLCVEFTPQGWAELDDFYKKVAANLLIADTAFVRRDKALAEQLLRHKDYLRQYERELRDRHFARLNDTELQSQEAAAIHLDILMQLKRINSSVTHVGYAVLQENGMAMEHRRVVTD